MVKLSVFYVLSLLTFLRVNGEIGIGFITPYKFLKTDPNYNNVICFNKGINFNYKFARTKNNIIEVIGSTWDFKQKSKQDRPRYSYINTTAFIKMRLYHAFTIRENFKLNLGLSYSPFSIPINSKVYRNDTLQKNFYEAYYFHGSLGVLTGLSYRKSLGKNSNFFWETSISYEYCFGNLRSENSIPREYHEYLRGSVYALQIGFGYKSK